MKRLNRSRQSLKQIEKIVLLSKNRYLLEKSVFLYVFDCFPTFYAQRLNPSRRSSIFNLRSSLFNLFQRSTRSIRSRRSLKKIDFDQIDPINLCKRSTEIDSIPPIFNKKSTVSELEWVERGRRAADKTGAMPHHSTEHTTYVHVLRLTSAWHACLGELSHGGLRKLSEDQRLESKS